MTSTVRNVLIVLLLAAAVVALPGGGSAARFVAALFSFLLLATLVFFAARLYRERRVDLMSLDTRLRALLYGSFAVAVLTVTGTDRLWSTGLGTVAWFALVGAASYGVFTVWRATQRY